MKPKAVLDKVIVKPISEDNVNSLGVYMGESKNENFKKGKVISAGEKTVNIKEGDIAYYNRNRASEIKIKGEIYDVMDNMAIYVLE